MVEDFVVVREDWNKYSVLPEQQDLRIKVSLTSVKIEGVDEKGVGKITCNFSQLLDNEKWRADKGPPSESQLITTDDIELELKFDRKYESINIYDVQSTQMILLCKPILDSILRTKKFDATGSRIYQTGFHLAVAAIPYPKDSLAPVKAAP
jgi:hypothetical protein